MAYEPDKNLRKTRITPAPPPAPPSAPTQVQEQGQLTNDEATVTLTNFTGAGAVVLDKDTTTEIVVTDPTAVSQIRVDPDQPMFVGYIGGRPGALGSLPSIVTITVTDINGVAHQKFVRLGAGLTADGIDTESFSTIPAIRIDIDFGIAGAGNDYDVSQVVIYKAKGRQYTNRYPQPVQARQELTRDDIESITLTPGPGGAWTGDPEALFDKYLLTEVSYDGVGYPASITINLKSPTRIPGMSIYSSLLGGAPLRGTTIDLVEVTSTGIRVHAVASGVTEDGISKSFQPIDATQIIIQFNDAGPTAPIRVSEIVIYKAIETQAHANRNATVETLMTDVDVWHEGVAVNGGPRGPGGVNIGVAVGGGIAALAGLGVLIEKDNNGAIVIIAELEDIQGIALMDGNLLWYFSDDDVTYYFGGVVKLDDSSIMPINSNPNPTGFNIASGSSFQVHAIPVNKYAKYLSVAVENDLTGAAQQFRVASLKVVKQR